MKVAAAWLVSVFVLAGWSWGEQSPAIGTEAAPSQTVLHVSEKTASSSTPPRSAPFSEMAFLRVPAPSELRPDSEAGKALAKAQELYRQGETNAAGAVLSNAVKDPSCAKGRSMLNRKLVALYLCSGRVEDAQAACVAYVQSGAPELFGGAIVTTYLIEEKRDANAAVSWTERLRKLKLSAAAEHQNLYDNLTALSAAGQMDEVVRRLPDILSRTNDVETVEIMGSVAAFMMKRSEFDHAQRFLDAVEKAGGGRNDCAAMVSLQRKRLEGARTQNSRPAMPK